MLAGWISGQHPAIFSLTPVWAFPKAFWGWRDGSHLCLAHYGGPVHTPWLIASMGENRWSHSGVTCISGVSRDREGTREIRSIREDQSLRLRDAGVRQGVEWAAEVWDPVPELSV